MANELTRRSSGLSDAHKELIRMLAEVTVEDFLRETADDPTPAVRSGEMAP
jgi:hypothetical protein